MIKQMDKRFSESNTLIDQSRQKHQSRMDEFNMNPKATRKFLILRSVKFIKIPSQTHSGPSPFSGRLQSILWLLT